MDAYPGQTFTGRISQIRLNAQDQQNVVTYSAVIDVSNTDQRLLPGMTANITVIVARAENVLTIPNAALRFKPDQPEPGLDGGPLRTIFELNANNQLAPHSIRIGITNGRVTAISEGDLHEGDVVVIGKNM